MKSNGHVVKEPAEAAVWDDTSQVTTIAPAQEPEILSIPFQEWVQRDEPGVDGQAHVVRKRITRTADIDPFVPAKVIRQFFEDIDKIPSVILKAKRNPDGSFAPTLGALFRPETQDWLYQQVLNVWVLSEPDMTLERLITGVPYERIFDLWGRMFTAPLTLIFGTNAPSDKPPESQG